MNLPRREGLRRSSPDKIAAWQRRGATAWRRRRARTGLAAADYDDAGAQVAARSGGRCEARVPLVCTGTARVRHHVRPRAKGGPDTVDNLLHVCDACHAWIHQHPAAAKHWGWLR